MSYRYQKFQTVRALNALTGTAVVLALVCALATAADTEAIVAGVVPKY
jgi:hypothetical protein